MFRQLGSLFSFLTILPVGNSNLTTIARHMYLFPVVGIGLGLLVGAVGFGLSFFLDPLIVGLVVVAIIAILTGIHHTDGLSDFADGLMAKGTKENKLAAMKDLNVGSAGIVTIVLYLVGLIVAFSMTEGYNLLLTILLGEIMAKFSMVFLAGIASSVSHSSSRPFIDMMNKKKLILSGVIALTPIILLGGYAGLALFGVGMITTIIVAAISMRSFGGITGDVFGATNELTRLTSVMVFVII